MGKSEDKPESYIGYNNIEETTRNNRKYLINTNNDMTNHKKGIKRIHHSHKSHTLHPTKNSKISRSIHKRILNKSVNKRSHILRIFSLSIFISLLIYGIFFSFNIYIYLYGSIPWKELEEWIISFTHVESILTNLVNSNNQWNKINGVNVNSPFINATFQKAGFTLYELPVFQYIQEDPYCIHSVNYDVTIPPGGWIIYSSCNPSSTLPNGFHSIRALGYLAYSNSINASLPSQIRAWYHSYYKHIQVPISITEL
ncbi:hypothetical protein cand_030470 [Cryptosporidium andersoni]|uniref:Uncharacterized protein n=1 Tax=Cryptosporidium andersoni TaxID=117008 RepID=A0A1J4MNF7_9CRYT|nr:hypothetical protein cand_030470 [Cryptosporidium andersoni]